MLIPKIIHQIWIGPKRPPMEYIDTWKATCGRFGWTHKLWTDEHVDSEVKVCRKEWDEWDLIHFRADLYRLEVVYRHGGIYLDADYVSMGNDPSYFIPSGADLIGTTEHHFPPREHFEAEFNPQTGDEVPMSLLLQCGLFGATPRHPQILRWMETSRIAHRLAEAYSHRNSVAVAGAYHISRHLSHPVTVLPFQWLLGRGDSFAMYHNTYPEGSR